MATQRRYFQRISTGQWYAGFQESAAFIDDGWADARAIGVAVGLDSAAMKPVTLDATAPDPRDAGPFLTEPPPPADPLAADLARLRDYMPGSGSATAQAVSAFIGDNTKDPAIRATMAALRSLIRVARGQN